MSRRGRAARFLRALATVMGVGFLVGGGPGCGRGREVHDAGVHPDDLRLTPPRNDLGPIACGASEPCPDAMRCYLGFCIADSGPCATDEQCEGDTYCVCPRLSGHGSDGGDAGDGGDGADGGVADGGSDGGAGGCLCVPWGVAPRGSWDISCRRPSYELSEVVPPVLLCKYDGEGVETTPIVADLDGDGAPEILFMTAGTVGGTLHAIHGADCSLYFDTPFDFAEENASQLAVADLDGDGAPEIVGVTLTRQAVIFDHRGKLLASALGPYAFDDGVTRVTNLGGPAIVDLDGKSPPEIVVGGQALRYNPKALPDPSVDQLWVNDKNFHLPLWGVLTVAADLDGDGAPEVVAGGQIYRGTSGAEITPPALFGFGNPYGALAGIGDFNLDGKPDIGLVASFNDHNNLPARSVAIYDYANATFLLDPVDASDGWGGAPTIADFDGDGLPEMAVAGVNRLILYSPECADLGPMRPSKCDPKGLAGEQWSRAISDQSSGSCSSAAFDFNGDGAYEIVYRDECWLRALDGKTGKALFAVPVSSASGMDGPVVADLDNDGHAELIVSSTAYPACQPLDDPETGTHWTGLTNGILVFSDPTHKWMPARPLWNQHSYHVTNILDDLTVPNHEEAGWKRWNGYRQNEQGLEGQPDGIADFTARPTRTPIPSNCDPTWTLSADLCNRGAGTMQKGIAGAFYSADPRLGSPPPLCVAHTTALLKPGACETVSCDWQNNGVLKLDLWFRADDDGVNAPAREECRNQNDVMSIRGAACVIPQ